MCYHKHYIFRACGHGFFSPRVLLECPDYRRRTYLASSQNRRRSSAKSLSQEAADGGTETTQCPLKAHPYQTIRLNDVLCYHCGAARAERLREAEESLEVVKFEERKWRVTYIGGSAPATPRTPGFGAGVSGGEGSVGAAGGMERERQLETEKQRQEIAERKRGSGGRTGYSGGNGNTPKKGSTDGAGGHGDNGSVETRSSSGQWLESWESTAASFGEGLGRF